MIYEAKSQPCLAFNLFTFGRITLWGKKPVNATPNSAITMFILLLKVTGISEDRSSQIGPDLGGGSILYTVQSILYYPEFPHKLSTDYV